MPSILDLTDRDSTDCHGTYLTATCCAHLRTRFDLLPRTPSFRTLRRLWLQPLGSLFSSSSYPYRWLILYVVNIQLLSHSGDPAMTSYSPYSTHFCTSDSCLPCYRSNPIWSRWGLKGCCWHLQVRRSICDRQPLGRINGGNCVDFTVSHRHYSLNT